MLKHVPKCHLYVVFERFQGWGLHHLPGQPGSMLHNPFSKEIFHNIQSGCAAPLWKAGALQDFSGERGPPQGLKTF